MNIFKRGQHKQCDGLGSKPEQLNDLNWPEVSVSWRPSNYICHDYHLYVKLEHILSEIHTLSVLPSFKVNM